MPGRWRAGGVGKRGAAAAVLLAASLVATMAGVAAAGEPDDAPAEVITITCENGEPVVVEPTEEEPEGKELEGWGETGDLPDDVEELVVPAEPGDKLPPEICDELAGGTAAGQV